MKGKLIVCEGLDCSGKTTAIKSILYTHPMYVYSKGIGSESKLVNFARRFPSTFIFISELIFNSFKNIFPNLRKSKILLQDRYLVSISSFIPNANRFYNRLLIYFADFLIPKPSAIVYFHLPIHERLKRLKEKAKKYELILFKNPKIILRREREYEKWFNQFSGPKIKINTQQNSIEQTSKMLEKFIELVSQTKN